MALSALCPQSGPSGKPGPLSSPHLARLGEPGQEGARGLAGSPLEDTCVFCFMLNLSTLHSWQTCPGNPSFKTILIFI